MITDFRADKLRTLLPLGAPPTTGGQPPARHAGVGVTKQPAQPMAQRAPGGLLGEYEDPKANWADKLGLLGGIMMDLGGVNGGGNAAMMNDRWNAYRQNHRAQFDDKRRQEAVAAAMRGLSPEMQAIGQIAPGAVLEQMIGREFAQDEPITYGTDIETIMLNGKPTVGRTASDGSFVPIEGAAPYEEPEGPLSTAGKLYADLLSGRITQAQFDAEMEGRRSQGTTVNVNNNPLGAQTDPLSGIGYGSAQKGEDAAIAMGRDGNPIVTPGPQQEAYNKAFRSVQETNASNSIVLDDIDRALEGTNNWSAGGMAWTRGIPALGGSTPAGELDNLIKSIRANVGFDKLQTMREVSPTGGALGQVTEKELAFLQAVFGSLEQDQRPENLRYNLERLKDHVQGREERLRQALTLDYPSLAETARFRSATNQQVEELSNYRAPDGSAVTEEDIQATMAANNMTREEVLARLQGG